MCKFLNLKTSFSKKVILCISLFIFTSQLAAYAASHATYKSLPTKELERFAIVINNIKKYYYKSVTDKTLFDNAISGMLSELDPHSAYLNSDDLKDLELATIGKFGGIGIEIMPDNGLIKVISPLDDTPAYKAGIKAGDYIVQINNKLVRNMTLREAVELMRGPRGSTLTLTIIRKNVHNPITVTLKRKIIKIKTIKERILEDGYGYIRIAFFQEETENDLNDAIKRLLKKAHGSLRGVILDLRNNPGGLLESAIQVSDDFLDANNLKDNNIIVSTKSQAADVQFVAKATPGELLPKIPLVVLINEGSASASEVVAGALQDHKRAIITGTQSFGKGSVQTLLALDDESAIKITTALYYTPLDRSIQAKGIEPDIKIEDIKVMDNKTPANEPLNHINEASLIDHIQNGDEDQAQTEPADNLSLAMKDYQLYESLNILKSLTVVQKNSAHK
jgi:carboxyl-terminal processing protease